MSSLGRHHCHVLQVWVGAPFRGRHDASGARRNLSPVICVLRPLETMLISTLYAMNSVPHAVMSGLSRDPGPDRECPYFFQKALTAFILRRFSVVT
jgi:hypothetical protein